MGFTGDHARGTSCTSRNPTEEHVMYIGVGTAILVVILILLLA